MTHAQHLSAYKKIADLCARFRRAVTCRSDDTLLPPRAPRPGAYGSTYTRQDSSATAWGAPPRAPFVTTTTSSRPPPPMYTPHPGTPYYIVLLLIIALKLQSKYAIRISYWCSCRLVVFFSYGSIQGRIYVSSTTHHQLRYVSNNV